MSNAPENAIEIIVELRWSDQDMLGHINNAKIMTVIEEARIRSMGLLLRTADDVEMPATVLRKMDTEFYSPMMYPGETTVRVWISKIGKTSYILHHEVSQNEEICVTCDAVMVVFSTETQSSIAIPDPVRQALEPILNVQ